MNPRFQLPSAASASRLVSLLTLAVVLALAGSALAAERATAASATAARQQIRAAAEVVAIDPGSRTLTLRREDGNTLTVVADKRIRNFGQVRVGDIVIAQYGHARALSLRKARPQEIDAAATSQDTKPVTGLGKRTLIADIIAIDDRTRQATLKGIGGEVVDVVFSGRKALASVRIGDRVRLEYTTAVAVSITPAGSTILPKRQPAR